MGSGLRPRFMPCLGLRNSITSSVFYVFDIQMALQSFIIISFGSSQSKLLIWFKWPCLHSEGREKKSHQVHCYMAPQYQKCVVLGELRKLACIQMTIAAR